MAGRQYDLLFKLLLIGDSGVSKTCILYRLSDDAFNTTSISTIGIDFKIKTIALQGKKIKLQIWDTAGQERFHTITTCYYRGAMGIMLVYDITNMSSFDNISKWLRNIDENASADVVKMLLGNMRDMQDPRAVQKEQGQKIAAECNIKFMETSAKANINIDTAFNDLASIILERMPNKSVETYRSVVNPKSSRRSSKDKCCSDTAGQERFHCITHSYYRKADGIVLVYDITDRKSFDNISRWLRNIEENAPKDVVKILLGNKCDMPNRRFVSRDLAEKIAADHNIKFLETSAKANINIDNAFYDMAKAILEKQPDESRTNRSVVNPQNGGEDSAGGCCF